MKIAILGGTFNPIHFGHISMAEHVLEQMNLDKICFLPNGNPPHKTSDIVADKFHRLEMVKTAIESYPDFFVSDYEITKDSYCYTVDTIKYFLSTGKYSEIHYIIGADSLFSLSSWKNSDELKKICSFIVCDRNGQGDTDREIVRLLSEGCRIKKADMPFVDIDSTTIRSLIKSGKSISGLTPTGVIEYISENRLYKISEDL